MNHRDLLGLQGVLKKFANFTGKDMFFIRLLARLQHWCFPVKFAKIFKNIYLEEHLRKTASIVASLS